MDSAPLTLDLLCHCEANSDGHEPGAGACEVQVKPVRIRPFSDTPLPRSYLDRRGGGLRTYAASGTCPSCGRTGLKVARVEVRGEVPGQHSDAKGVLLGIEPSLAEHAESGEVCPGTSGPPAEIRFTPSREIESWSHVHGPAAVRR